MAKEVEFMKTTLGFDGNCIRANTLTEAYLMVAANIGFLPVASKQKEKTDDGSITSLPLMNNNEVLKAKFYAVYKKSFDEEIYQKLIEVIKDAIK